MTSKHIITSFIQYQELSELDFSPTPECAQPERIHEFIKVGFYRANQKELGDFSSTVAFNTTIEGYLLPTAVIILDNRETLVRLPISLSDWVLNAVSLSHMGMNPFPCKVKIGIHGDRHFADIL